MKGHELSGEHLSDFEEVTEVSEGVGSRNHRGVLGSGIDPFFFKPVFLVGYLDVPAGSVGNPVSSETGRKDAVEHIDSPIDSFDQVLGSSESHQVMGFRSGKVRSYGIEDADHIGFGFPDRKSSDSHSGHIEVGDVFHTIDSEIVINNPLCNRE